MEQSTYTIPLLLQYANQIPSVETPSNDTTNDLMVSTDEWYNETSASLFNAATATADHDSIAEKSFTRTDIDMECQQAVQDSQHAEGVECSTCKRNFKSLASLNKHIKSAHNQNAQISADEYKFQCEECGKMYSKKLHLTSHMRAVHTNDKFECKICGKLYSWEANLQAHHLRIHSGKAPVKKNIRRKCDKCNLEFASNKLYDEHMDELHHQAFHCEHCSKRMKRHEYSNHLRLYHRKMVNTHKCDVCGMLYHSAQRLQNHVDKELHKQIEISQKFTVSGEPLTGFRCITCSEEFTDKTMFINHLKIHRTPSGTGKKSTCTICGRLYNLGHMRYHMKSHSGIRDYECQSCDYKCRSIGDMKKHRRVHTDERPYQCDQCGRRFRNSSTLVSHVRRHKQAHTHTCKVCHKGFYDSNSLENHEALHTVNWTFICQFCRRKFCTQSSLRRHINSVHKHSKKPYRCIGCTECFTTAEDLQAHGEIHRGQHFCCFCRLSCKTEEACREHEAVHMAQRQPDNTKQYACPLCPLKFHLMTKLGEHHLEHDDTLHCTVCGETFTTRLFVIGHLKDKHLDEFKLAAHALATKLASENSSINAYSSYSCAHCSKSFTIERNLAIHLKTHKEARPFGCPYCYKSYGSDKELKAHQDISHQQVMSSLKKVQTLIVKSLLCELDGPTTGHST